MLRTGGLLALLLSVPSLAGAQPLAPADVPPALVPWVPWALDGAGDFDCTQMSDGGRRCTWPGELSLTVEPGGARFEERVFVDSTAAGREDFAVLPGDARLWPLEVQVDGRAMAVRRGSDPAVPAIRLTPGAHVVTGHLRWTDAPETVTIPSDAGRVVLRTAEGAVTRPRRDGATLWLQTSAREAAEEDTLSVEIFRRIEDGSPLRILTRVVMRVAGRPREIRLGQTLLDGARPISVRSDAPVRMTEDGELTVQVQPGSFEVEVTSVRAAPDAPLRALPRGPSWPEEEIWVWASDEALRQVELSGADRIDPDRTNLPAEWRGLPTWLLRASEGSLTLTTARRGNPAPAPNQFTLSRELWLDPDGTGLTGVDHLGGTVHQRWRIELEAGELGRAQVDGQPHLISARDGRSGVELRRQTVDVRAEWRDESARRTLAAVGWDEDVQSLSATLHMAPGFRLLHATGVDHADTWASRWNLWAIFFVLVIGVAIGRLAGLLAGSVSIAVLALSYHEPEAPFLVWIPLVITLALATMLPAGIVRTVMRWCYAVLLALLSVLSVYFSMTELRAGLWPQTVDSSGLPTEDAPWLDPTAREESRMGPPAAAAPSAGEYGWDGEGGRGLAGGQTGSDSSSLTRSPNLWTYEPNAVLQTGPGVPSWQMRGGQTLSLGWDGPVTRGSTMTLWLLSPPQNSLISLLIVLLLAVLLVLLWHGRPEIPPAGGSGEPVPAKTTPGAATAETTRAEAPASAAPEAPAGSAPPAAPSAPEEPSVPGGVQPARLALGLALASLGWAASAQAQPSVPPADVLAELRARLTRPPLCAPACADVAEASITLAGGRLSIDLDVQAGAVAAVAVPGPLDAWTPETVHVDAAATTAAARVNDGYLHVRVPEGAHHVRIEGALPSTDAFTLSFAAPPRHATVTAPGWEVDGLRGGDQIDGSIQLRRSVGTEPQEGGPAEGGASVHVAPWLTLERTFALGIRWEATTTLRRVSAAGTPIVVRIPLLPGESVLAADLTIEGGAAVVTLGGNETERSWTSVLTPREEIVLTAPEGGHRSETWSFSCGTVWRCETSGLDPVSVESGDLWQPSFRPFPADAVHMHVARLPAAEGQSTTIDGARLSLRPGERLTIATLTLEARSSVGAVETITLPEDAVLHSVTVAGQRRSVEQHGRDVSLTIAPGSTQIELEWQEPRPLGLFYTTSPVSLSGGAVNVSVAIERPSRWILHIDGPWWGSRILFWHYIVLLLAVSYALFRSVGRGGLGTYDWLLLALGVSQLPWQVAWIVPSWVLLVQWRERRPGLAPVLFDLRQLFLVGWTFVAAIVLYAAIHIGLLVDPDTTVLPAYGPLEWYVDRIGGEPAEMPQATILSTPVWAYHLFMLGWALWLAVRLMSWARWAFGAFGAGGYWRPLAPPRPAPPAATPPAATPPAATPPAT